MVHDMLELQAFVVKSHRGRYRCPVCRASVTTPPVAVKLLTDIAQATISVVLPLDTVTMIANGTGKWDGFFRA